MSEIRGVKYIITNFLYDEADGLFREAREGQPVLINPMLGQVICQFGKLYFFYKIDLAKKQARLKRVPGV
jgi:hypothetical protein